MDGGWTIEDRAADDCRTMLIRSRRFWKVVYGTCVYRDMPTIGFWFLYVLNVPSLSFTGEV